MVDGQDLFLEHPQVLLDGGVRLFDKQVDL